MKLKSVFILLALSLSNATAQVGVYEFLRSDVGARAAALQGSFLTMPNDPNTLFYNPAALTSIDESQLSIGYFKHLAGIISGSISYADSLESIGTIGIGVLYFDYGSFDRTDASEYILGTFGASDIALVAGLGMPLDEVTSAGVSVEYIHSSLAEYSSSAVAIGFGVTYYIPSQNLTLGGSILHAGKQLNAYNGTKESLPLDISIGLTKRPEHVPVYLNVVFHRLNKKTPSFFERFRSFTFGAEFLMSSSLRLRFGYNNEQRRDLRLLSKTELAGFALGGGLYLNRYVIDYAYNSYGIIGGLHHFSIGIKL